MKGRNNSLLIILKTVDYYRSIVIKSMLCFTLSALLITCLSLERKVYAADDSITISNDINGNIVSDVTWKAYKIADYGAGGQLIIDSDFGSSNVDFSSLTTREDVANAATTFANIVLSDGVSIDGQANAISGIAKITGLDQGVYLIVGSNVKIGSKVYGPAPMIVEVITDSSGVNVDVAAKFVYNNTAYKVEKLWKGDDASTHDEVIVELYKDGVLDDTVRLNESNNWKYTWESSDETAVWSVKEKTVIKNYKVSYRNEGSDYVVVNTYNPPEEESTMTVVIETTTNKETENDSEDESEIDETDEDETDEDETEEITTKKGKEDDEQGGGGSAADDSDLPQTGLLWWPVIPLFVIGIILVFVGIKIKNNGEDSEE
ncbi:Cna B-type domain-containing protein [uncultured Eubacterium sp.]|uniref:Cna B-type domain-containing protein n=1 Tax=uncultured Eubacterium sp. TaxID=165185 RepID=UPI00259502CB|nr:Cna B-type domain-containing protein [uncultured Eubacterium sp.]